MDEDQHQDQESQLVGQLTDIQLGLALYVRSLMPGDPAARDVAQHANTTIWKKRQEFKPGTNFKAWAFSIARYEVLNYRKKQARDRILVFSDDLETLMAEELSEQAPALEDRHEALQHCLGRLPSRHRNLLMHRYASNTTLKDYSEEAGTSVNSLKVTLHRLRNTLLTCMKRHMANALEPGT